MVNVFDFFSLPSLLAAFKKTHKMVDVAKVVDCTHQKIHYTFKDKPHWVYPDVRKWRKALGLNRLEGDYFELLAIIAAYRFNTESTQKKMLQRAFHLAGRLEEQVNPNGDAVDSLVYWLDPMVSILRNMVELADFPKDENDIPEWGAGRITYVGMLGRLKKNIPPRIEITWRWMRKLNAVTFSKEMNRWVKTNPNVLSTGRIGPEIRDIQSALLVLNQINTYQDFIHEAGGPNMLGDKLLTLSLPGVALPLLEQLTRDFLFGDILAKVTYMCNADDLARLKKSDPGYYQKVIDYKDYLIGKGYLIPDAGDKDMDSTVQALFSIRRLTK